jgi:hypothetical protein
MQDDEPVPDGLLDETRERIGDWNELGKGLCGAFVDYAVAASKLSASPA